MEQNNVIFSVSVTQVSGSFTSGVTIRVLARVVVSSKGTMGESSKFTHIVVGWILFLTSCWLPRSLSFSWTGEHSWLFSAWGQLHKIGGNRAASPTQNKQARDKSWARQKSLFFCNVISEGTSHDFYHQRQVVSVAHTQALQGSLESGPETFCHSLVEMLHSAYAIKMKLVEWGEGNTLWIEELLAPKNSWKGIPGAPSENTSQFPDPSSLWVDPFLFRNSIRWE